MRGHDTFYSFLTLTQRLTYKILFQEPVANNHQIFEESLKPEGKKQVKAPQKESFLVGGNENNKGENNF